MAKKDINVQELYTRVDSIIVFGEKYCSMYMIISLIQGLAKAYGMPEKEMIAIYNERRKMINIDESYIDIGIEYN